MKKLIFGLAIVVSFIGTYTASQTNNMVSRSFLSIDDIEAEAQEPETFHEYKYGNCTYRKCDQGGNYIRTSVWVKCQRTVSVGVATVTEEEEIQLNKCFYGGNPSCSDDDSLKYYLFN